LIDPTTKENTNRKQTRQPTNERTNERTNEPTNHSPLTTRLKLQLVFHQNLRVSVAPRRSGVPSAAPRLALTPRLSRAQDTHGATQVRPRRVRGDGARDPRRSRVLVSK
jgi:hypothetical protein